MLSYYDFKPCYQTNDNPPRELSAEERRACLERLFRLFYNQAIHPELLGLERRRRRLINLMALSVVLLLAVVALQIFIGLFVVTLILFIPVALWSAYLIFRIQVYFEEFKPRIVGLILDFIDNDLNYKDLRYKHKGFIPKKKFLSSKIFTTADDYTGEDLITGQVREMPFELCELRVREFSPARNRLDRVFVGLFLAGDFHRIDMRGELLLLPDAYRKYLTRSERAFHLTGGRRVEGNLLPEFEVWFDTYATPDLRVRDVISTDLQHTILDFRNRYQQLNRQKEIYLSIIGDNIYIALTQDKDLLEPSLWANTVSFETVREMYQDITMVLDLVKAVDVMN